MDKIRRLKYILILVFILTTITTFITKKAVYNLSKEIIEVENQIADLETERYMLRIEWSYLTSPERLMEISEKTNLEQITITAKQIKKLKDLTPYYYAKSQKENNVNPIAKLSF